MSPGAVDTPIYQQAANYAGRAGHPPPPVISPDRLARAVVKGLRRPRDRVEVGPANALTVIGFRLLFPVYRRLVGPLTRRIIFRGSPTAPTEGNVVTANPRLENHNGGWTTLGRHKREEAR